MFKALLKLAPINRSNTVTGLYFSTSICEALLGTINDHAKTFIKRYITFVAYDQSTSF